MQKIALVTGGNRGIGWGTCRELVGLDYDVILTSRDEAKGKKAAEELGATFLQLDVSDINSIDAAMKHIEKEHGHLEVLVNNAGILPEKLPAMKTDIDDVHAALTTNAIGPFRLCQKAIPLMLKKGYGRIVNVSSGMGALSDMSGGYASYRLSKTCLNAVTKVFAEETRGKNILINSVCPGWVRTDMGGDDAQRSLEAGVSGIIWAATLENGGPTGGFFRDGRPIPW